MEEKEEWINGLAEIYSEQGYKIRGKQQTFEDGHTTSNEIIFKIVEVTGLNYRTVALYLRPDYKQTEKARTEPRPEIRISAGERIEHELGEEYVERFRKEVLEEANLSPEEKKKREGKLDSEEFHPSSLSKQSQNLL